MKKKILVIATYGSFFTGFEFSNLNILKDMGFEIHGVANFNDSDHITNNELLDEVGMIRHQIAFSRSPLSVSNISKCRELAKLMKSERFYAIDTHNPVISVYSRIAAKIAGVPKVIYNAHGFFFYKGAPKINVVFKWVESTLAGWTDALITINKEDYAAAKKMKVRGKAYYIHGVGFDLNRITNSENNGSVTYVDLSLLEDVPTIASVGELRTNKNHAAVIRALALLRKQGTDAQYVICGVGDQKDNLLMLARELGVDDRVHLLGLRDDVIDILRLVDIYVHPSFKEGLSMSIMEAMACGLPVIATCNGGPKDLIPDGVGGYLVHPDDIDAIASRVQELLSNPELRERFGSRNAESVKSFALNVVKREMKSIYHEILQDI